MKWVVISGSWRKTNSEVEKDVREVVKDLINQGKGIITGGALNVDYFALDESMKLNPKGEQIKVFLPTTLANYAAHYRKRAAEGVITPSQAEILISQLTQLKKLNPQLLDRKPS